MTGAEYDNDDELRNFVVYGEGPDGAIFSRRCPKCGKFLIPQLRAKVNDLACEAYGECKKCGTIELVFIGWAGDYDL